MRFIDLQAGVDLGESTPAALQLLRQLYKSTGTRTDLNKGIGTVYFDINKSALAELQKKVEQLPFYQEQVHPPVVLLEENEEAIAEQLMDTGQPALAFLNPMHDGIAQQFLLHTTRTVSSDLLMLFNQIAKRIISNTTKNIRVGSVIGKY